MTRRWQVITTILATVVVALAPALAAAAEPAMVEVPSIPLWTSTGLQVEAGQRIRITVPPTDTWSWGGQGHDAAGAQPWEYPNTDDRFLYAANHGELIGYVGEDPYQGNWGNYYYNPADGSNQLPGYLHVGELAITPAGFETIAAASGPLCLGFNDDTISFGVGDNWGSVHAAIAVDWPARLKIDPETLDVGSNGQRVTAYVTLPGGDPASIDASSLRLWPVPGEDLPIDATSQPYLADADSDGTLDLVVKFSRSAVVSALCAADGCPVGTDRTAALRLTGNAAGGTPLEGAATIRVIRR